MSNKTNARTIGIVILTLIVAIILILLLANPWAKNKVTKQLASINEGSKKLTYGHLDIDLFSGNFTLNDISFSEKNDFGQYEITLDQLQIDELGVFSYLFNNEIRLGKIKLNKPDITFTRDLGADSLNSDSSQPSEPLKLPDLLVKSLDINDGAFTIRNKLADQVNDLVRGSFNLSAIEIAADSAKKHQYNIFDLGAMDFEVTNINYYLPDSLNQTYVKKIAFNLNNRQLEIDSITYKSRYKKYELANIVGNEIDWIDLYYPTIVISGIDMEKTIMGNYYAERIAVEGLDVLLFRDKRPPFPDIDDRKLLHEAMAELKANIAIDTITLKNGKIIYQEHVEQSGQPGMIMFDQIYATFYNLTNVDSILRDIKSTAQMDVQAMIMGKSKLTASFTFPLEASAIPYTVSGSLDNADIDIFNPMLTRVVFVTVDSGEIHEMDFDFSYNEHSSSGAMTFLYQGLKISTINKGTKKTNGMGQGIKSFVANTFIVKTDNLKKNGSYRVGEINFKRDKKKSLFNYWWKSLLSGIKSSTGIQEPKEKENERSPKK